MTWNGKECGVGRWKPQPCALRVLEERLLLYEIVVVEDHRLLLAAVRRAPGSGGRKAHWGRLAKRGRRRQSDCVNDYDRAAEIAGVLQARLGEIHFPLNASVEREIQRQVFEYADELKGLGLPPERVIVAVKRVANEAGLHSSRIVPSPKQLEGKDKLLVDMVGWCIERYYGKSARAD